MSAIRSRFLAASDDDIDGCLDDIQPHPKDPNYRRLSVNGRAIAQLSLSEVNELKLTAAMPWNRELYDRIEAVLRRAALRRKALQILGRRAYSRATLRAKLVEQVEADATVVDALLSDLESEGWLNDEALADSILHELTRTRPAGPRLIEAQLTRHGIDGSTIDNVRAVAEEQESPADAARRFASQELKKLKNLPLQTAARRLAGRLHRRGFDEETITATLEYLDLAPASEC